MIRHQIAVGCASCSRDRAHEEVRPMTSSEDGAGEAEVVGGVLTLGDLPVHRLGFGTARILWSGDPDPLRYAVELLREVVDAGVTLLDTADCYEGGAVEEAIAAALHPYPDNLVIATKGGIVLGPQWANGASAPRDGRPEVLRKACEDSLRRLRTDCIDVYQLHTPDPAVSFEASVGALAELQREGKIRHIGLSNVGRRELAAAAEITEIVSVQNKFNLESRSSARVLAACEQRGIAFLPYEPGQIRETPVRRNVAARHAATVRQVAIAWTLRCSAVTCPIPGTSNRAHAAENLAAGAVPLSAHEIELLAEEPSAAPHEAPLDLSG
jgi:pyridoxine 4-dehydrogenase